MKKIEKVGIIGAGTMGSGIAAHLVNAGIPVVLLDIPTPNLDESERGDRTARNRLVQTLFKRMVTGRPVQLGRPELADQVTLGNTEDDLSLLADCDWVVEVIIEQLAPKQALMARLAQICKPDAIVTSNTSGIPINEIVANCSADFQARFLGTHFFNPPRYLKLLELIPTEQTDPAIVARMSDFGRNKLGKGVVLCKDTPNFIANRFGAVTGAFIAETALSNGYPVAEADMLLGPLIGRPKTGYFRLADLVGLDIRSDVIRNLYPAVPHDAYRDLLIGKTFWPVFDTMLENGWIGNKKGQGFVKKMMVDGKRQFWTLDTNTFEYKPTKIASYPSVEAIQKNRSTVERIRHLLGADDRGARLVKSVIFNMLEYAAYVTPEIAYSLADVDNAVRWGFNYQIGPFELWDALGVAETAAQMEAAGHRVADWVKEMLAAGVEQFYAADGVVDFENVGGIRPKPNDPRHLNLATIRAANPPIATNNSASLHDMGDGVLLFEFHSKVNALDIDILSMGKQALAHLEADFDALVIGNEGRHFSVGANLGKSSASNEAEAAANRIRFGQEVMMALRHSSKPVVTALHGRALGGGCEIAMTGWRSVAHHEFIVGLVEFNVGIVPAWTGVKELLRRHVNPVARENPDAVLLILQKLLTQLMQAKVSSSAWHAKTLGYLREDDVIVMNPDHRLLVAKELALELAAQNLPAPDLETIYAAGTAARAALVEDLTARKAAGKLSAFDLIIGRQLANILTGGDLP
ncbi:MAG: 3-hydroxyacyl-CoA dehydrogenase/enoyl-CoA hydratase family protein, partial [Candidatus Promineifilaceae bacterium]